MEGLKRKRAGYSGAITRIFNKCQKALAQDPSELDPRQLEHQIDAIKSSDSSYKAIHEAISDKYEDTINFDEEEETLAKHDEFVEQALSLTQRLIAIHLVHSTAMELHHRVHTMERKQRDSPDKSYSTPISAIVDDYRQLHATLRRSAIPASHSTRSLVSDLDSRIADLSSTDRPSSALDVSTSSSTSTSSQVKLCGEVLVLCQSEAVLHCLVQVGHRLFVRPLGTVHVDHMLAW